MPAGDGRLRVAATVLSLTATLLMSACQGDSRQELRVATSLGGPVASAVEEAFEQAHPEVDLLVRTLPGAAVPSQAGPEVDVLLGVERPTGSVWSWRPLYASPLVLVFNTDSVSRGRAPRGWIDLFHPRWRDALVLPPSDSPATRALVTGVMLREERRTGVDDAGRDWLFRLDAAAQGHAADEDDQLRRVRGGHALFTLLPLHRAAALVGEIDRVAVRALEEGAPAVYLGAAIRGDPAAPAPDAFLAWAAGREAVTMVTAASRLLPYGSVPAEGGTESPAGSWSWASPWPALGGEVKVWSAAPDTVRARGPVWMERWRMEILGQGKERY